MAMSERERADQLNSCRTNREHEGNFPAISRHSQIYSGFAAAIS